MQQNKPSMAPNSGLIAVPRMPAFARVLGAILAALAAGGVQAQTASTGPSTVLRTGSGQAYPSRPIRLIMSEGGEVTPTTTREAAAFVKSEVAKWGGVIGKANITAE